MPVLFGTDIAGLIGVNIGPGVLAVSIARQIASAPGGSDNLTAGVPTTTSTFTARGFVEEFKEEAIDGTRVQAGDRKVIVLGATIAPATEPAADDVLTVTGEGVFKCLAIIGRDPAAATYVCHCRR